MISRLKPRLSVPDFARQNPERKALVRDYIISMPPMHSLVKTPTINCMLHKTMLMYNLVHIGELSASFLDPEPHTYYDGKLN